MNRQATIRAPKLATSIPLANHGILQRKCACRRHTAIDDACDACRQKHLNLQRQATHHTEDTRVSPVVHEVLKSPGRPLDTNTRRAMETHFGKDLSQVRIHTDGKAASSAKSINAQAYTVGQDIVFGKGKLAASTREGQKLLAHELAHVIQQTSGNQAPTADKLTIDEEADTLEREADKIADKVVSGERQTKNEETAMSTTPAGLIQRDPIPGNIDTTLRVSPFMARGMGSLTLTHFAIDSATLTSDHRIKLTELAGTLSMLLRQYPGGMISVRGHTDATGSEEHNLDLGQKRADAVRDALVTAGISADAITTGSGGETSLRVETQRAEGLNRRVEITFQPEPIASLGVPPLTLQPPRQPVDLRYHPPRPRPETMEERLNRILRQPLPERPRPRSFNDLFWQRINEGLDSVMSQAGVPEELRPLIRRGVRAGIERGAEAIVDEVLDAANIQGEAREAFKATLRGASATPIFE